MCDDQIVAEEPRERIAFAIPELDSGGPDRVFATLLNNLDRDRYQPVLLVGRRGGRYFDSLRPDIHVEVVGGGRYPVLQLGAVLSRQRPALLVSTLRMNITAALSASRLGSRPILVARQANAFRASLAELEELGRYKYRLASVIARAAVRVPAAVIAQSPDMASELAELVRRRQSVFMIGNPIDLDGLEVEARAQARAGAVSVLGRPALVAMGRLVSHKGFDLLLKAMPGFLTQFPETILTVVGEGPERRQLEELTRMLGIDRSVVFEGFSDSPLAVLAGADVVVCSSRHEAFSNVVIEAMGLGKTVVATNAEGANRHLISDGETGVLTEDVSVDALERALLRSMTLDRQLVGEAAKRFVGAHYSVERVVGQYTSMFDLLLGETAGGTRGQEWSRRSCRPEVAKLGVDGRFLDRVVGRRSTGSSGRRR